MFHFYDFTFINDFFMTKVFECPISLRKHYLKWFTSLTFKQK